MKYSVLVASIVSISLLSCSNHSNNASDLKIIDATCKSDISLTDIFKSYNVIPLENTSESLIGVNVIKIEQYQEKLFILNQLNSRRNILCFDSLGHYLFSIDHMGYGPQEYTYLSDFILDTAAKKITVCSEQGEYVQYDLNGKYLTKFTIDNPYCPRQMVRKNDSTYCAFNYGYASQIPYDLLDIDSRSMNIRHNSAPRNQISYESECPLSALNGKILYCDINDTIYDVTNIDNRQAQFVINFGEDESEIRRQLMNENITAGDDFLQKFMKKYFEGELHVILNIHQTNKWIGLSYAYCSQKEHSKHQSMILYNKETNQTYMSDKVRFNEIGLNNHIDIHLVGSDENKFICVIYDALSNSQRNQVLKKTPTASARHEVLRQQNDNFSNPLILILQ